MSWQGRRNDHIDDRTLDAGVVEATTRMARLFEHARTKPEWLVAVSASISESVGLICVRRILDGEQLSRDSKEA